MFGITETGVWLALPSVKGCMACDVWQMGFGSRFKMGGDFRADIDRFDKRF